MPTVYLAVGHGHRDDGTFDPGASGGGWDEQSAGDHIVKQAATRLRRAGFTVHDEAFQRDPNYPGTTRAANRLGVDVAVSVHHDWVKAPEGAFGHWVSSRGKGLADDIQAAVGDAGFPLRPSWHKYRSDLYFLNRTIMPSVLYEVGRIGSSTLDEPYELRAMGEAIAIGIARHFNVDLEDLEEEGDDDMPLTDDDVTRIAQATAAEVASVLGWHDSDRPGAPVRGYDNDIGRIRRTLRKMAQQIHLPDKDIEV